MSTSVLVLTPPAAQPPFATVLGKRKNYAPASLIHNLSESTLSPSSASEEEASDLDDDWKSDSSTDSEETAADDFGPSPSDDEAVSSRSRTRVTSRVSSSTSLAKKSRPRKYTCPHDGCEKAYTKPSRLAEHERTHTGDRPFACETCGKAYFRETHLTAHVRTHLSKAAKPFICSHSAPDGNDVPCDKRFWTKQHLDAHVQRVHEGVMAFSCEAPGCPCTFAKQHQLRAHFAAEHCAPGTKPFRCEHEGCDKSFSTSQKLRTHNKVHEENRYACSFESCRLNSSDGEDPVMRHFATWTDLQRHVKEEHPPTCPHPECEGRTFTAQKGLRAHMRIHEDREREAALQADESGEEGRVVVKRTRRGGEIGRDWACERDGCEQSFKSKKALDNHENVTHLGARPFTCSRPGCGMRFGYKHVLQRHLARKHSSPPPPPHSSHAEVETEGCEEDGSNLLDLLTGEHYTKPSRKKRKSTKSFGCPWPGIAHPDGHLPLLSIEKACAFVFSRKYDLRRHLKSVHGLEVEQSVLDAMD